MTYTAEIEDVIASGGSAAIRLRDGDTVLAQGITKSIPRWLSILPALLAIALVTRQ